MTWQMRRFVPRLGLQERTDGRVWLWSALVAVAAAILVVPASPAAALPSSFKPFQIINGATPANAQMCLAARDDPPVVGSTPIVQKPCSNTSDRLEGWYNHVSGFDVPDLQRSPIGIMWLTQGTWCIGGDVSNRGHPVKIVGTYLDSSDCLSFNLLGNALGMDLQETTSGLCLGISGGALTAGAGLIFWTCEGTRLWKYPNPPDIHGGQKVKIPNDTFRCTLGFNVYDQYYNSYFLTAGHCVVLGQDFNTEDTEVASVIHVPIGYTFASADYGAGGSDPGGDWALVKYENAGYTTYGTTEIHDIVATQPGGQNFGGSRPAINGEPVSFWGGTTGHLLTGRVTNPDISHVVGGITFNHLIETSICTQGGDSGGPLVGENGAQVPNVALGTLMGGDSPDANGGCPVGRHSYFMPVTTIHNQILAQTNLDVNVY